MANEKAKSLGGKKVLLDKTSTCDEGSEEYAKNYSVMTFSALSPVPNVSEKHLVKARKKY